MNRPKHILILGSGFAGIETLRRLQKKFEHDSRVELTLVSKDNFLLFTPMLPEVSVGMQKSYILSIYYKIYRSEEKRGCNRKPYW